MWKLSDETDVHVYGTFYPVGKHGKYSIAEIDLTRGHPGSGLGGESFMRSQPDLLGMIAGAEDFLDTYYIRPLRPKGWSSDLDEHRQARTTLAYLMQAPSVETMRKLARRLLTLAESAPTTPLQEALLRAVDPLDANDPFFDTNDQTLTSLREALRDILPPEERSNGTSD